MTAIGDPPVDYWDMYFILKLLKKEGQYVHVDVEKGEREYHVLKTMYRWNHIFISDSGGFIDQIAVTKKGITFYKFLRALGFGTKETEEEGRQIIERLTKRYIE